MTGDEIRTALDAGADNLTEVVKLVVAAGALVESCGKAKDLHGYRQALELKLRAERAGGAILRVKGKQPVPLAKLGITRQSVRWRGLAALDDADFAKKITDVHATRRPPGMRATYLPPVVPAVATITAWKTDEHGVMSRQKITAGETPMLKREGHSA